MTSTADLKRDLAYAYQILAYLKLDDHTYTHLSARPKNADYYFIYPFGLRFEEVTPDNLLKVALDGTILEGSESQYNQTGYVIHGSIYQARQDLNAIFHLHTVATIAVSAMKQGLLPISQWALHFYERLAFHEYNSLTLDPKHGQQIITDLADYKVMFLRNHGIITCGTTIQEAMFYTYHIEQACKTQCSAMAAGVELVLPDAPTCRNAVYDLLNFEENLGRRDWQAWVRALSQKVNF